MHSNQKLTMKILNKNMSKYTLTYLLTLVLLATAFVIFVWSDYDSTAHHLSNKVIIYFFFVVFYGVIATNRFYKYKKQDTRF